MTEDIRTNSKRKREQTDDESRTRIAADDLPAYINYWLNEATPDCYFKVGPESGPVERIGALKTFLAAHSEPLRVMFELNYEEGQNGEVRVVDVEADTFKTLLKCICGGSHVVIPKLTIQESAKLLQVADKYLVDHVKNEVVSHMGGLLTCKNVFTALSCPACLQSPDVSERILGIVQHNTKAIMLDRQFLDLSTDALFWVLQQKNLNTREVEIWNAVLKWGKHKSRSSNGKIIRRYIYPFLNHIRFLAMNLKELWKCVVPSKVLNLDEIVDISKSLSSRIPHDMNYICRAKRPRQMHVISDKITMIPITYVTHADVFCTIKNCKGLKWQEDSKLFSWSGLQWKISVGRRSDFGYETLAVFVSCYGHGRVYYCPVRVTTTLINDDGTRQHYRTFYGNFTDQTPSIGLSDFCGWQKMGRTYIKYNEAKLTFGLVLL